MEHKIKQQVDLSMIAPEEFSTVLCNILQEQEAIGRLSDDFLMRGDRIVALLVVHLQARTLVV